MPGPAVSNRPDPSLGGHSPPRRLLGRSTRPDRERDEVEQDLSGPVRDGLALLAIAGGILALIALTFPSDGRVAQPVHDMLLVAFGRGALLLPVLLIGGGGWVLLQSFGGGGNVSRGRLVGAALLAAAVLPVLDGLARRTGDPGAAYWTEAGGLIGAWLASTLVDWLGLASACVVILVTLLLALLLLCDITVGEASHRVGVLMAGLWRRLFPRRMQWRAVVGRCISKAVRAVRQLGILPPGRPDPRLLPLVYPTADEHVASNSDEIVALALPAAEHGDSAEPAWVYPPIELFTTRTPEEVDVRDLSARSRTIEETLASFNIAARVVEANRGPAVTQFGVEPSAGTAVSRILSRQNDLALRLGASPIRLEAPVPGKRIVGVEVPNSTVATVMVRDVIASPEWERAEGKLRLALGRNVSGESVIGDLGRMPHLLIAGATGAGKSVCINTIVGSLLYQFSPDELQLVMIDPKRVELVGFGDAPHLRLPVITEMDVVVGALRWVVLEMERRYKLFAEYSVRNLEAFNRRACSDPDTTLVPLPALAVVIDELADMMMTAADEVEKILCRLAQLARATGIHLVVATQRPSVDVLTGLIKANFPTRIAFAVSSQTDSRVILDQAGAEKLLGRGDALYMPSDAMKPLRLQGAFVSDEEMASLVNHWSAQGPPRYSQDDLAQVQALGRGVDQDDELYERASELAETVGRVSASLLQRRLNIGHSRAQRLLERLQEEGLTDE